jgi:serine/threonine protein kinase
MLTGTVPFPGETPVAIILAHLHQPPPSPRSLNPAIPDAVERVLLKCLAKRPQDRYPSANTVIKALEATRQRAQPSKPSAQPPQRSAQDRQPTRPEITISGDPKQTIEYATLKLDLRSQRLMWNGIGMEKARDLLSKELQKLRADGWELAGSLQDPGVFQRAKTMSGPMIREAVLLLRRVRA